MKNYLLMKRNKEVEEVSAKLGYSETYFLGEDFVIVKGDNRRKVLESIRKGKDKIVIYDADSEEMLRFVLEKTPVDIIMGMEKIHKKDSVHYIRGGLDQIACRIAATKEVVFGFSFSEISDVKILRRIMFNMKLCKKFKVGVVFSGFFNSIFEIRSAKDLEGTRRVLEKNDLNIFK